jgi:hypothetical protein
MIVSYNASVVKIHNTTSSLVKFEIKNIFFYFEKCCSLRHTTLALYVDAKSEVVGLAPAVNYTNLRRGSKLGYGRWDINAT